MSVVDFLFQGSAPTPGSTSSTTQVQLPEWYTQYTTDMLGKAQAVSNLPYAQYTGPRIAGFTPTEQAGFEATKQAATAYQPFLQQAGTTLGQAGGVSALGVAQPFLGAAGQTFPGAVGAYMSPYTQNVVNQIAEQGVRQLQEKYLPAVGEEFIKAGQFGPGPGSSRMGEFGARALRDVQEAVLGEQAKALESGYKTAADIFGTDVGRMATLAGTAGQLGLGEARALQDLAARYGETAGTAQRLGLTGAEAVGGVGEAERRMQQANLDLAYKDFLAQQEYPKQQIQFLGNVLQGVRLPQTTVTSGTTVAGTPGGPSNFEKAITGGRGVVELLDFFKKYFPDKASSVGTSSTTDVV
jgi:hypothetical protein